MVLTTWKVSSLYIQISCKIVYMGCSCQRSNALRRDYRTWGYFSILLALLIVPWCTLFSFKEKAPISNSLTLSRLSIDISSKEKAVIIALSRHLLPHEGTPSNQHAFLLFLHTTFHHLCCHWSPSLWSVKSHIGPDRTKSHYLSPTPVYFMAHTWGLPCK